MVKGGDIGNLGGGSLEHPRQWLGAQWAGLFLGVPSRPEPPGGAPEEAQEPSWGAAKAGILSMLPRCCDS